MNFKMTSRRDDLISLFYFIVFLTKKENFEFLLNGDLTSKQNYSAVRKLKNSMTVEEICSNCP